MRPWWDLYDTRVALGDLAAVGNDDFSLSRARSRADVLNGFDDVHALADRAKDNVLAVEPWRGNGAEEELPEV